MSKKLSDSIPRSRTIKWDIDLQKVFDDPEHPGFERLMQDTEPDPFLRRWYKFDRWMNKWGVWLMVAATGYFIVRFIMWFIAKT